MTNHSGANLGCLLVGEYVDEAEVPTDRACHPGEVVRPHVVARYLDLWSQDEATKEFTVLLKDNRTVTVRGHSLKNFPPTVPGQSGSYGVALRAEGEEVLVALFQTPDVIGIFAGQVQSERQSA